jgi:hypothetical protein
VTREITNKFEKRANIYRNALLRIAFLPKKMTVLDLEAALDLAISIAKEAIELEEIHAKKPQADHRD